MYKVDINKEMEEYFKNPEEIDKNFDKIIELNKPLIFKIISLMRYNPPITKEELFQESVIELLKICKKYKKITTSFTAYFCHDLKNYLINYIQRNQYVMTIPYPELRKKNFDELNNFFKINETDETDITDSNTYAYYETNDNYEVEGFEDERLNEIRNKLTDEEWEMVIKIIVEGHSVANYGELKGITRQGAIWRWNKIKKKIGMD